MSIDKKNKLNLLFSNWYDGQIKTTGWLKSHGYSNALIQKYKKGQWIEPIGKGAYKKYGDSVNWVSVLSCVQQELKLAVHVSGKSALQLLGKSQYIAFDQKKKFVIGNKKELLPFWAQNYNEDVSLEYKVKKLFKKDQFNEKNWGYTTLEHGRFFVILSSPERAFLEYLDELPKLYSYSEALDLLENLPTLRSSILQNLLESCSSIKVKRLFLHLAEKINHPWFKKIDLKKISLGTGKRHVFKDGVFDSKYLITVPKELNYEES